jgi:hypothetical protein
MSTLMEDRLTAALRARADLVQPEDLRPVDVPVVSLEARRGRAARRRRMVVLAGLAAAACTAAVAGPLLLNHTGGNGSPQPAGPTEPQPTSSTQRPEPGLSADVDGDGRADDVRLVRVDGGGFMVVVDRATGERAVANAPVFDPGPLVSAGDLGGSPGDELVLPVTDEPSVLPAVYTWMGDDGLVLGAYPSGEVNGWRPDVPVNRWSADGDGLRTWEAEQVDGEQRVPYWDWVLEDGAKLRPGPMRTRCLGDAASSPEQCPDLPEPTSPDTGAHGDLPELMPPVEELLVDERFFYGRGRARGEYAQLQGDFGEEGGAVADGDVELVVTAMDGKKHRVPIPAGQSPRLVPQPLMLWGDAPAFLVQRSGGDTSVVELYSFWNGDLVPLEPASDVFLGSGFVDHQGEMAEQRTWITPEGLMFTAILLDWETRRHQLWQWDPNAGETISTTDLGEVCIDRETRDYGRC